MSTSKIEWTEQTWNPIVGCSIVSPGCAHCYAMRMAARINKMTLSSHYEGLTQPSKAGAVWTGKLALAPDFIFTSPLRRKKPTTYFVNSMGDLFHEDCPDAWIDRVFAVMALCPQHTFQVLTKRAKRMKDYFTAAHSAPNVNAWQARVSTAIDVIIPNRTATSVTAKSAVIHHAPPANVWLGVSAERQQEADERIPLLLQMPAAVRFVSCEPLLGPISIFNFRMAALAGFAAHHHTLHWVIAGGESGPGARPMHPDWARKLRDECGKCGNVKFFFKQWGEWEPHYYMSQPDASGHTTQLLKLQQSPREIILHASEPKQFPVNMVRVGKKAAGRLLDGKLHDEFPEVRA